MIDQNHHPRLIDFGLSQALSPRQDQLSYLWTDSVRPGASMWAAPELLHPDLYPDLKVQATFSSDIYSLGSILLFVRNTGSFLVSVLQLLMELSL